MGMGRCEWVEGWGWKGGGVSEWKGGWRGGRVSG